MTTATPFLGEETDQTTDAFDNQTSAHEKARLFDVECLCPFCGSLNGGVGKPCSSCNREDTAAARAASRIQAGQWFVLQSEASEPTAITFHELQAMVQKQTVTPRSVVRGPSTGQLWRLASKVRGLSREFGHCYSCDGSIDSEETICPHCDRIQTIPENNTARLHPPRLASPVMREIPSPLPVMPRPVASQSARPKPVAPTTGDSNRPRFKPRPAEPAIHVHSFSNPAEPQDLEFLVRPIIAEQYGRHIPKDDLLTPRDVAKAFQLEFGIQDESNDTVTQSVSTASNLRFFASFAVAIVIAIALGYPLERIFNAWKNASPSPSQTAIVLPALAVNANEPQPAAVQVTPTPSKVSNKEPVTAVLPPDQRLTAAQQAASDPVIVAEPNSTASPLDDPAALWATGLNAESARDFAGAVNAYERIESLPSNLWPPHLEVRLSLARKELKGDLH